MKKPRQRIRRGFDFLYGVCDDALGRGFRLHRLPDADVACLGHQEE
jgi:hypothetical protein